jgi:hypothetical protein
MIDWKQEIARRLAELKLDPIRKAEIAEELSQHDPLVALRCE